MATGTYFFDTATFANATTVYTDATLTQIAADGWYSDNIISREQINGILGIAITCNCSATPTPTPTPSSSTRGRSGRQSYGYTYSYYSYP